MPSQNNLTFLPLELRALIFNTVAPFLILLLLLGPLHPPHSLMTADTVLKRPQLLRVPNLFSGDISILATLWK